MGGAVRLGGNIELFGIENFDGATVVVLKKIIGNYARKFSEKGLERLSVSFEPGVVKAEAISQGSAFAGSSEHNNVFFSVDNALKEIEKSLLPQ